MPQYNLFSVSLISAGLALFYSTSLRSLGTRQSSLPGFIGSFLRAPRFMAPRISKDQGFSYIAETDVDTVDSSTGVSPFVMLEDGVPLPMRAAHHPIKFDVQAVREQGQGRYIHRGRRVFFSPRDNAGGLVRQYLLLETLTLDRGKIDRLLALTKQRDTFGNIGAWLLSKLLVYADDMLTVGKIDSGDPAALMLQDVRINLDHYSLGRLQADRAAIRWTKQADRIWHQVTLELRDLTGQGLPANAWLTCRLGFTASNAVRLEQLALGHGGTTWLHGQLDWSDDHLQGGEISCINLAPLRQSLETACGGPELLRSWISSFTRAISSGDLPLGCRLDAETAETLVAAFSPESDVQSMVLRLARTEHGIAVSTGEAA